MNKNIGKPAYALVDMGVFSKTIISGIVTGVQYTEDEPLYTIAFGKNTWKTDTLFDDQESLVKALNIPTLERVSETHNLKIKYS